MRLYDTATRGLVELPEPGERPIGMYFCGPTVYQRIHVGNARPFVVSMWLRRWLEERGHDVTLVENITDINDKIYAAAPGRQREARGRRRALVRRGHRPARPRPPGPRAARDRDDPGDRRADRGAGRARPRLRGRRRRLLPRRPLRRLRPAVGRHDDESAMRNPSEEEEQSALKENPRDFALWKAHKEGEDTWWDSPWGRGRPGWHIECSAMAEKHLGPAFEIHGGGLDLVFPHHENEIAQSRGAGREFARIWMHNGMLRLGGEKMSKSLGNLVPLRDAVEEWGRETILMLFLGAHWRKPMDYSDETLAAAKARAEGFREVFRNPSVPGGSWDDLVEALDNDFNTPEALAVMHEWRDHDLLRARARSVRARARSPSAGAAPAELDELARKRAEARAGGDFDEADRLRAGDRGGRAGRCATSPATRLPARPEAMTAPSRSTAGAPVREALRGPREVLELWATERALAAEAWLRENGGPRVQVKPERELTDAAGTRDHQGVVARVEPYRYADAFELARQPSPLLVCLDRVTDPHNLGAVAGAPKEPARPA